MDGGQVLVSLSEGQVEVAAEVSHPEDGVEEGRRVEVPSLFQEESGEAQGAEGRLRARDGSIS